MDVSIKRFDVDMALKTNGMELDIKQPNGGEHVGDVVISKTGIVWCQGKVTPQHGIAKKLGRTDKPIGISKIKAILLSVCFGGRFSYGGV